MPKVELPQLEFKSTISVKDAVDPLYELPFSTVLLACDSLHHERSVLVSDISVKEFLEVYGIATHIGNPKAIKAKMIPDYNFKSFYKLINKEFVRTINELTGAK